MSLINFRGGPAVKTTARGFKNVLQYIFVVLLFFFLINTTEQLSAQLIAVFKNVDNVLCSRRLLKLDFEALFLLRVTTTI